MKTTPRNYHEFLRRYINHLFKCYKRLEDVIKRRDLMFDKIYHL